MVLKGCLMDTLSDLSLQALHYKIKILILTGKCAAQKFKKFRSSSHVYIILDRDIS